MEKGLTLDGLSPYSAMMLLHRAFTVTTYAHTVCDGAQANKEISRMVILSESISSNS
jgi:hypothetical protein